VKGGDKGANRQIARFMSRAVAAHSVGEDNEQSSRRFGAARYLGKRVGIFLFGTLAEGLPAGEVSLRR
jgi:hypothetical protein